MTPPAPDVEALRHQLRAVLRDINVLNLSIESNGLPDGTHALATALRQQVADLATALDRVLGTSRRSGPTDRPSGALGSGGAVDEPVLRALLDDLGGSSRVVYLVQLFLTELHGRRVALHAAVAEADLEAAHDVANILRTSSLLLGATDLANACQRLSDADDRSLLRGRVDAVLHHATEAARWFQIWLANQSVPS